MLLTPVRLLDGPPIRVVFEQLSTGASDIATAKSAMYTMVSDLESSLEAKMNDPNGGWDGAARLAYGVEKGRWRAAMDAIDQKLDLFSRKVDEARERYYANEQRQIARYTG